jgi:hypothetical protein
MFAMMMTCFDKHKNAQKEKLKVEGFGVGKGYF